MGHIKIVDGIEKSTMVSTWTEYLCLHRNPGGKWQLDIRGYEGIGEASEFEDEDGELPHEINGQTVIGHEDGYVIIDNLVLSSDECPIYEFDKFDADAFDALFRAEHSEWCSKDAMRKIRETILNYAKSTLRART